MEDYIVRASAAGAQIRAFAATTGNLVEEARVHHNLSPVATAALGRLLTGGSMMGSMMKNDTDMLTLQIPVSYTHLIYSVRTKQYRPEKKEDLSDGKGL